MNQADFLLNQNNEFTENRIKFDQNVLISKVLCLLITNMKKFLLFVVLVLLCLPVSATTVKNLYEVSVPVFTQSDNERKEAVSQAFAELLIRVTGRRNIALQSGVKELIKTAPRYMRSFRYEQIEEKPEPEAEPDLQEDLVVDAENQESGQLIDPLANQTKAEKPKPNQYLVVSFDKQAVKNVLWKNKLPVWGETRPSTLLWIAVQDAEQRNLIDVSEPGPMLDYLSKLAIKRGLPLVYPLLDLEDQMNLNVTDVWGGFKDHINNASARYQTEAVVSARLSLNSSGIWQSRWSLYQGNDESSWQINAVDLESAVVYGLDNIADKLAERYAHVSISSDENATLIYISDVNNLSDYEKINDYLSSLSAIKNIELRQVQANELVYRLELRSNKKVLKQAISLGKVLLTQEDPFATNLEEERFNYRLMQ